VSSCGPRPGIEPQPFQADPTIPSRQVFFGQVAFSGAWATGFICCPIETWLFRAFSKAASDHYAPKSAPVEEAAEGFEAAVKHSYASPIFLA
jgi:hypothetical protein